MNPFTLAGTSYGAADVRQVLERRCPLLLWPPHAHAQGETPSWRFCRSVLFLAGIFAVVGGASAQPKLLDSREYHLGATGKPEWQWFEGQTPFSNRLDIHFTSEANEREATLFLRQTDVKLDWPVHLNGRKLGTLFLMEQPLVHTLAVPPGFLKQGKNTLSVLPPPRDQIDDITVGEISLDRHSLEETLTKTTLEAQVSDGKTGKGLPCRITIVNERGDLAPVRAMPDQALAVRPGVIYTGNGLARLGVLPGRYTIYANRGFEYGLARQTVTLREGASKTVKMQIAQEVPTHGWVSCDTHIHTFTYARHGDATIEERMLTLAGEGIELPISTEHNVLIDFSEPARKVNVRQFFTPVIGCEITTDFGHFNAFPMDRSATPPNHHLRNWPSLIEAIRATPGVQVVILNHPRDAHAGFVPFAPANFNSLSGENLRGSEFTFDAIEVINSGAMQSDWMLPFRDWFALLNHGCKVTAIASSDAHDVSRFIVGQGRSYVAAPDYDARHINVSEACESIRRGRVLLSLGLFTTLKVDGRFGLGDLATGLDKTIRVESAIRAPSWIQADQVELFANGKKIREARLEPQSRRGDKSARGNEWTVSWEIPKPAHDFYLVAVASGPGVTAPYWPIARPYQPASRAWTPRVIGATNPIWIDGDGDGKFSSAHTYATSLVEQFGEPSPKLLSQLEQYDEAVCIQTAALLQSAGKDVHDEEFLRALHASPDFVRRVFALFSAEKR